MKHYRYKIVDVNVSFCDAHFMIYLDTLDRVKVYIKRCIEQDKMLLHKNSHYVVIDTQNGNIVFEHRSINGDFRWNNERWYTEGYFDENWINKNRN